MFSTSSGSACPAVKPSASRMYMRSSRNPGVGKTSRKIRNRLARYPVSSMSSRAAACRGGSPGSMLPATSSQRSCRPPRRYFSITTIPPPANPPPTLRHEGKADREQLELRVNGFPEINVIGQGKNGVEAVSLIKEHSPDLVFLDVQMPGLDGFGVLKKLVERKMKVPHVVFATAFDHYAVQAFEVNAVDYVLKPFDKGRIAKAIQRARKVMETETSPAERLEQLVNQLGTPRASTPVKVLVKSQQRLLLVDAEEVIFASIESGAITVLARDVDGPS